MSEDVSEKPIRAASRSPFKGQMPKGIKAPDAVVSKAGRDAEDVIDATGGKPGIGLVLGGEIGYVRRREEQEEKIPEEERNRLLTKGMLLADGHPWDKDGLFDVAASLDETRLEMLFEGAADTRALRALGSGLDEGGSFIPGILARQREAERRYLEEAFANRVAARKIRPIRKSV